MRYQVIEGSQSGHCCFEFTVVDTHKPHEHFKERFEQVCETFDKPEADMIADGLNMRDEAPLEDKPRTGGG